MSKKASRRYLVTIGTFDGVHLGHQKLMRWVIAKARKLKLGTRVVFFAVPPAFYFRPELAVPLLTTSRDRRGILRGLGIDRVEILRFGPRWARMLHTRFFNEYIVKRWRAGGLLVGRDFGFGMGRKGDLDFLKKATAERGMHLGVLPLVRVGGRKISSSDIRRHLLKGDVERAARLLGRPFSLWGRVVRGRGLGREMGFPTANLGRSAELAAPPGVFHVRVTGPGMIECYDAVCNIGIRPTLGGAARPVVEVHIPGRTINLYGRRLRVEFKKRLRREKHFASLDALKRAIRRDISQI